MACCFRYERFPDDKDRGCQFASETDFTTLDDGTTWCRFHLPMRDKAGNASPKVGWHGGDIDRFNEAVFDIIDAAIDAGGSAEADLTGVVFPKFFEFNQHDKKYSFPQVSFHSAIFSNQAGFREVRFSGHTDFREAIFSGMADFESTIFTRNAIFGITQFKNIANFREASFSEYANFEKATFSDHAIFREVEFAKSANFQETVFSIDVDFSGKAEAVLPATPSRNTFQQIDFPGVTFGGPTDFNNRRFTGTTSFRGAIFERAPKFHNAELHQDTDFEGADFRDVRSADAERNYRTLKLAMETMRSRRLEAKFFAYEQRSLRNQSTTPRTVRWASAFYDWAAEYGLNFARPLWRMVQLFAVSWLSFWTLFGFFSHTQGPPLGRGGDIVIFALQQVFRPFEVWRWRYEIAEPFKILGIDELPLLIKAVATVETLFIYGLFTLFLLALRKRFRML